MEFEKNIKEWVALDNQEKKLKDRVKEIRSTKNNISDKIFVYTEENNLGHATIEISDGKLKFQNTKITSPLTFKFLEKCLNECIENKQQVDAIIKYVKSSRESKYEPVIKRMYK
tara:strand:+ start:26774 stop:27115 length:342 start_codon:yes stop_codon:yes gene_type:complete